MKTFKLLNSELCLPNDFYVRVGASNGSTAYYQHVYCSRKTLRKIEKRVQEFCELNLKSATKAKRAFTALIGERGPKICDGIKSGFVLVDTKAITREILDEEMINDLATSQGKE